VDGHESAQSNRLEFSQLVDSWHVVEPNLEVSVLGVLVAKVHHELSDCLPQIALILVELIGDLVKEVDIREPELTQVIVVNEHSHFLICSELFCVEHIVPDWLCWVFCSFSIGSVVGV
jgi:hypothetical protein